MRGTSRNLRAAASRQQLAGVANDSTTTEAHNVTIESTEAVCMDNNNDVERLETTTAAVEMRGASRNLRAASRQQAQQQK